MPRDHSYRASYSPRFAHAPVIVPAAQLKQRFLRHRDQVINRFAARYPHAVDFFAARKLDLGKIRQHSHKLLTGAGLSTALLLSTPTPPQLLPAKPVQVRLADAGLHPASTIFSTLGQQLAALVPQRIGHLDPETETQVTQIIKQLLGISAASTLDGQRLNHSLGWIGYEQHLYRFPGDSLAQHDELQQSGIAPHTGAWGYFANSHSELTPQLVNYEKYYVAVQTLYLPNWTQDLAYLRDWYKFRKVLVVNVDNGRAVVAVIADSGPAEWTSKQFGGSPEVMQALDLTGKASKGKVLLFFVDAAGHQVPVGPVTAPVTESVQLT